MGITGCAGDALTLGVLGKGFLNSLLDLLRLNGSIPGTGRSKGQDQRKQSYCDDCDLFDAHGSSNTLIRVAFVTPPKKLVSPALSD